jgi:hypothetical protein
MSKKIKNIEHRPFGAAKMGTRSVLSFSPLFPSFFLHSFGFFCVDVPFVQNQGPGLGRAYFSSIGSHMS